MSKWHATSAVRVAAVAVHRQYDVRPAAQDQAVCWSSQSNIRCSVSSRAIGWQW